MEHSPGQITLGHKTNFNKSKMKNHVKYLSQHNGMKLEINYKKTTGKKPKNTCRLNKMILNNQQVNEEIKEKNKKYMQRKMVK